MKKLIALLMALCLCFALCACDSADYKKAQAAYEAGNYEEAHALFVALGDYEDSAEMAKKSSYMLGRQQMLNGDYALAIATFKALGDYEDSAELILECHAGEINTLIQGTWTAVQLNIIHMTYVFNNGRYQATLDVSGNSISNEGSYRIDPVEQAVYVCYDYIYNSEGEGRENTEEQLLFTYTYEGGVLALTDSMGNACTHK